MASASSILCTASTASFDPQTHQLVFEAHHLLAPTLAYSRSFPHCSTYFARPPRRPYHSPPSEGMTGEKKAKRRKVDRAGTTGEEWEKERLLARDKAKDNALRAKAEKAAMLHHDSVSSWMQDAISAVREEWLRVRKEDQGWTGVDDQVIWRDETDDDNGRLEVDWAAIQKLIPVKQDRLGTLMLDDDIDQEMAFSNLVDRIVLNTSLSTRLLSVALPRTSSESSTKQSVRMILPALSGFLLSDFSTWSNPSSGLSALGRDRGGWDLIIIDPPWPNASADRGNQYSTFDSYDLFTFNLKQLLGNTPCMIAVWITNKTKYRRLLIDQVFPSWGIEASSVREWYWVKITTEQGEPVFDFEADRRCYEGLVIGYYNPMKIPLAPLPLHKAFLSAPLGHSRKPLLLDLLRPCLLSTGRSPNVLELFARTAVGGQISAGNEAIKFNAVEEEDESAKQFTGWIASPTAST